jgi:hypothetical protein
VSWVRAALGKIHDPEHGSKRIYWALHKGIDLPPVISGIIVRSEERDPDSLDPLFMMMTASLSFSFLTIFAVRLVDSRRDLP